MEYDYTNDIYKVELDYKSYSFDQQINNRVILYNKINTDLTKWQILSIYKRCGIFYDWGYSLNKQYRISDRMETLIHYMIIIIFNGLFLLGLHIFNKNPEDLWEYFIARIINKPESHLYQKSINMEKS